MARVTKLYKYEVGDHVRLRAVALGTETEWSAYNEAVEGVTPGTEGRIFEMADTYPNSGSVIVVRWSHGGTSSLNEVWVEKVTRPCGSCEADCLHDDYLCGRCRDAIGS
jgi:hypothetical protein